MIMTNLLQVWKNGHVHTPFCPHGTKDTFEQYIEVAIKQGFREISFTEHAPLPRSFVDPTPQKDSSMSWNDLDDYILQVSQLKKAYAGQIQINCGFEVDYIEGYEDEIRQFLNDYGPYLDDSILSVHFLKHSDVYDCVDYSPQNFEKMISTYGTLHAIYKKYYETVKMSIIADLGDYKPRRIGHLTLVKKFQKKFPNPYQYERELTEILELIKEKNYEIDYNGAGVAKPLCGETYPPLAIAKKALQLGIPLIYGSDAHQAKELIQGLGIATSLDKK